MTASRILQYGGQIVQDVLFRCGEVTDLTGTTSDYLAQAKRYVQTSYYDLLAYAPWPWVMKDPPGVLNVAAETTGTCEVTHDSTTVTLAAVDATTRLGWWFKVDGNEAVYRITAHTAGTAAVTLDATFKEDSDDDAAYHIFKDEYAIASDVLKIWRASNRNDPYETINIVSPETHHQIWPRRYEPSSVTGATREMSLIRSGKVRITPYPESDDITLEYEYAVKPTADLTWDSNTTTDLLLVPLEFSSVVSDAATMLLMIDKNDIRVTEVGQMFTTHLQLMEDIYLNTSRSQVELPQNVKRGSFF